jgi:hypothetical protein
MGVHVFEEDLLGSDFADDAGDVRPEVAWVFVRKLLAGATERLARVAGAEDVRLSAIWPPVECFNVAPNVSRSQGAILKTRNQLAGNRDFPFHVAERASLSDSQGKSKSDAAVAGAKLDDVRYSHKGFPLHNDCPRPSPNGLAGDPGVS